MLKIYSFILLLTFSKINPAKVVNLSSRIGFKQRLEQGYFNNMAFNKKEYMRIYFREYSKTPLRKEYQKEYQKAYYAKYDKKRKEIDPLFKMRKMARTHTHHVLRNIKTKNLSFFCEFIGATWKEAKNHIEDRFTDGMTWEIWAQ